MNFLQSLLLVCLTSTIISVSGEFRNHKRIVNGTEVSPPFKYPFMTPLYSYRLQFCSGSLIHPEWVLTAGHCVGAYPFQIQPATHRHNISKTSAEEGGQSYESDFYVLHPQFEENMVDIFLKYDIALIHLKTPVVLTDSVSLIELDRTGEYSHTGQMSRVIGWGDILFGSGQYPDIIREVDVPISTDESCSTAYPGIDSSNICAGYTEGMRDACQGDSGGPMFVITNEGKYIQTGIVSSGEGCAEPGYPGTYARISALIGFIDSTIQNAKNPCSSSPCFNGGDCIANYPSYECFCAPTHTGKNCEIPVCPLGAPCKVQSQNTQVTVETESTADISLTLSGFPTTYSQGDVFRVIAQISHIRSGFLVAHLISPSGKQVSLTDGEGMYLSDCFLGTTWDDSFLPYMNLTCPFNEVAPEESFSSLIGENMNGNWILRIENYHAYRFTVVFSWGISLTRCLPGYIAQGFTCIPDSRTSKANSLSVIQRFLFNGNPIDSKEGKNKFTYSDGRALKYSASPIKSDAYNQVANIKHVEAITTSKIQLTDSTFSVEIVFKVTQMKAFDLFALLPTKTAKLLEMPLRVAVSDIGRISFLFKAQTKYRSSKLIELNKSHYLIMVVQNEKMRVYLDDVVVSNFDFGKNFAGSYFLSIGKNAVLSVDELAIFNTPFTYSQALARNNDF